MTVQEISIDDIFIYSFLIPESSPELWKPFEVLFPTINPLLKEVLPGEHVFKSQERCAEIVPDLLVGKNLYFIEIENARSLDSRRLRATLRKRIAYISAKAGVIKRVLPTAQVGVHVISPESCEIDDWVVSYIGFITFELDALRDKVRGVY